MRDNQERDNFYDRSSVHEGFIFAVSLLNDLIKKLVGLGIFNHVIFKDLGYDCYCKNSISQYGFTLRNIFIGLYHIYGK